MTTMVKFLFFLKTEKATKLKTTKIAKLISILLINLLVKSGLWILPSHNMESEKRSSNRHYNADISGVEIKLPSHITSSG